MAVCIPQEVITNDYAALLTKLLTFVVKDDYYESQGTQTFSGYRVDMRNQKKVLVVPFFFGMLFCRRYNLPYHMERYRSEKAPRISFTNSLVFRDDQGAVTSEALHYLQRHRATLLQLHPGYGKTAVSSYIAHRIGMVTLIIVHRTFLGEQFRKTFAKYTNATLCFIGEDKTNLNADVFICMITSMHKLPIEVKSRVGLVIVDEAHCYATGIRVQALMGLDARYLLFLTATPTVGSLKGVMSAFVGEMRVVRKCKKPFDVYCIDTNIDPVIESNTDYRGRKRMDYDKYRKSIMYNDCLNEYIVGSVVRNRGQKIMIITSEKRHVDLLAQMIIDKGLKCEKFYGNQTTHEDTPILISNSSKIKEGYDSEAGARNYDGVKVNLLYLLVSYKKVGAIEQTIGRVLRASAPVVVYFTVNANVSKKHSEILKGWASDMPVTIHNVAMNINPNTDCMREMVAATECSEPCDAFVL